MHLLRSLRMACAHEVRRGSVMSPIGGRPRWRRQRGTCDAHVALGSRNHVRGSGTRLSLTVEYTMPIPVIGKIAEAVAAKINERDLDTMLANLKDVMGHGTVSVGVGAHAH